MVRLRCLIFFQKVIISQREINQSFAFRTSPRDFLSLDFSAVLDYVLIALLTLKKVVDPFNFPAEKSADENQSSDQFVQNVSEIVFINIKYIKIGLTFNFL